jgi:integrase
MEGHVRKRGEKWYYSFEASSVEGKRKRIERVGGRTKKEAEAALRKALEEYSNTGIYFKPIEISTADYMDYWFNNYVKINCKYNTQELYSIVIKKHIKPALGSYKLKALTPTLLQEFINSKKCYSKSTIDAIKNILGGALKMAVHPYNYIKENPINYVKPPKKQKQDTKLIILSKDDFNKIADRLPEYNIPLQIAYHTGMRGGEVTALTWDNVDLDNGIVKVRHTLVSKGKSIFELESPKSSVSIRDIKIGNTLIKILNQQRIYQKEMKLKYGQWYNNSNFVCTKENAKPMNTNTIKILSRKINTELNINFNFHSLRHSHATMLLEAGANIKDIQKRLGHSKLSTTMDTYSHVTEKMENETVNLLESIFANGK